MAAPHPILQKLAGYAESQPSRLVAKDNSGPSNAVRTLNYGALLESVVSMRAVLQQYLANSSNADSNRRVAFLVSPCAEYVVLEILIWASGFVAVPLSVHSPSIELKYFIENSEASILFADAAYTAKIKEARDLMIKDANVGQAPPVMTFTCNANEQGQINGGYFTLEDGSTLQRENVGTSTLYCEPVTDDTNGLILYTSGTTGKPKGVVHTVRSLTAQMESLKEAWGWTNEDCTLHVLPLHHIHGVQNVLNTAMYCGACVEFQKFDARECLSRLSSGDITCFHAVPTVYTKILKFIEGAENGKELITKLKAARSKIRLMVCGSAALPVPTMRAWAEVSDHILLERYGMTEIGMGLSNSYINRRYPGCVGWPLPRVQTKLMDLEADDDVDLPAGTKNGSKASTNCSDEKDPGAEIGQLLIKGDVVFKEYWRLPEETKKSFTADGWFKTGDCCQIDAKLPNDAIESAKFLENEAGLDTAALNEVKQDFTYQHGGEKGTGIHRILGRNSVDIIKSGGFKISALEVEAVLLDHPQIREVAVIATPCETWGEKVTAVAVLKNEGDALALIDLRNWGKEKMATYKVPQRLEIWTELPRNQLGKLEKKKVMEALK